jgi:hypothetical protein
VRTAAIVVALWFAGMPALCAWPHFLSGSQVPASPCEEGTVFFVSGNQNRGTYYLCAKREWAATDPKAAGIFDVRRAGAHGDGATDDQRFIQAAARDAAAQHGILFFPPGTFLHSGVIDIGSQTMLTGTGNDSVVLATAFRDAAVRLHGVSGAAISNLKFKSLATARLMNPESSLILLDNAKDCSITGITIEGSAGAGIMVRFSNAISITHNEVNDTQADGIHVVDGSRDVQVTDNMAHNTGDDSFSAVAYRSNPQTDSVLIQRNVSLGSHARGVACIGAAHCVIRDNRIEAPGAHGIAVAYETAFDTHHPFAATVEHNIVKQVRNPVMNALLIDGATDVRVDDLQISDSTPIYCNQSSRVSLTRLAINQAIGVGIAAKDCSEFSVLDSHISGAGQGGIRVTGIRKGEFSRNSMELLFLKGPNGAGAIDVYASQDVTGSGNSVSRPVSAPPLRIVESPRSSVGMR